jgi:hypothetical protein
MALYTFKYYYLFIILPRVPLLAKYLCQRLTVLQESCKMAKILKYNKLKTSVVKIHKNTSITRRCQTSVRHQDSVVDPEICINHNQ